MIVQVMLSEKSVNLFVKIWAHNLLMCSLDNYNKATHTSNSIIQQENNEEQSEIQLRNMMENRVP